MAGTFRDTFKPVNVAAEKDELGNVVDNVAESVEALPVAVPAVAPITEPVEEPVEDAPSFRDVFKPVAEPVGDSAGFRDVFKPAAEEPIAALTPVLEEEEESGPNMLQKAGSWVLGKLNKEAARQDVKRKTMESALNARLKSDERLAPAIIEAEEFEIAQEAYINNLLPDGTEVGKYSETDIADSEDMYGIVLDFMNTRYGIQATEGMSKKEVVTKFLDGRRANYLGNSVAVLAEYDYLNNKKEDWDTLDTIGKGYTLYNNMAGVLDDSVTWKEYGGAAADTAWYMLMDPINVVGLGMGKLAGGVAMKASVRSLEHYVMKEVTKRKIAGESLESIAKVSANIHKTAIAGAKAHGTNAVSQFAVKMQRTGLGNLMSKEGLTEVAVATGVDAITASGMEFLYQQNQITAGAQDEVNYTSVGLTALFGLALGGVATARVATRGKSGTALPSETVVNTKDAKAAAKDMQDSINEYFKAMGKDMDTGSSWSNKVGSGRELDVADSQFFIDLLLGIDPIKAADGVDAKPGLKGLGEVMREQGFFYTKRDESDKLSNFIGDFIMEMEPKDVKGIIEAFESAAGVKIVGLDERTPEAFANAFAKKMSQSAQNMNAVSQVAKNLNVDVADMNIEQYLDEAMGQGMLKTKGDKIVAGKFDWAKGLTAGQNRFIRTLVSHPATSYLNVLGYGVSSGMGSANDVVRGMYHITKGSIENAWSMKEAGKSDMVIGKALLASNMNRVKLLLDPDMTAAAFMSALERNTGALEALNRVKAGGIDVTKSMDQMLSTSKVGEYADKYVNAANTATFVNAQDVFTKSQEYVFQMDKAIRTTFGKSWDEFYNSPDAAKVMATKQFQEMEEFAVAKTLEHTFGKSYKGTGLVGEVAGAIEDARNIPGLGLMVPFGRFFNNTIDFTVKNTPVVNQLVKKLGKKYPDKTQGELFTHGVVAGGLIGSMVLGEDAAREQGLGLYDSITDTGEVVSQQYDYPLSLFKAAARVSSYIGAGEPIPAEIVKQVGNDFFGGGLTRNLSKTGGAAIESVSLLLQGNLAESGAKFKDDVFLGIGAQLAGGFTRPMEPVDAIVGLVFGTQMAPQNIKDGNAFVGKALTYLDNTAQLFMGEPFNEISASAAQGEMSPTTTKNVGARPVELTNTLRVMNMLGFEAWDNNSSFKASKLAAGASNKYNLLMFNNLEKVATKMMDSKVFRSKSIEDQRAAWKIEVKNSKEATLFDLANGYDGPQSTFALQMEMADKYTVGAIMGAASELDIKAKTLGEMDESELLLLKSHIATQEFLKEGKASDTRSTY